MENLRGMGVLITRPIAQARRVAQSIRVAGGEPLLFPSIEIAAPDTPLAAQEIIDSLADFDWAIFISANAVEKTFTLLGPQYRWPDTTRVAAIGAATAEALRAYRIQNILAPEVGFDSEALLALAEMQAVKNARMVIFRGQGGRETLRQTLLARGAEVIYCETYRRIMPSAPATDLHAWLAHKKVAAISVMSAESLANLLLLAGGAAAALKPIPVVTHHPRVAQAARDAGFLQVFTCAPSDAALLAVLETLSLGTLL